MGKQLRYNKETLTLAVNESLSFSEVARRFDLVPSGSGYKTIRKYIELYGISTKHFESQSDRASRLHLITQIPLEEYLVEGSNIGSHKLKLKLYKHRLKIRECEFCGQGELWRGVKMSLILDHINGIRNDNRLENLRILCPNCNATLETHCSKNRRKKE